LLTKICRTCSKEKSVEDFYKGANYRGGYVHECKPCFKSIRKDYKANLPKERRIVNQRRQQLKLYSLTTEDYDEMLVRQGGVCAVCRTAPQDNRALAVDHDHSCCPDKRSCGKCVRALLCTNCNTILGMAGDDPDRLERLADYLRK